MKIFVLVLLSFIFCYTALADYETENGKKIIVWNLDEVNYYLYKGERLTMSGLINKILDEKRDEVIRELIKRLKP